MRQADPDWGRPRHLGADQHLVLSLSPCSWQLTPGCSEGTFAFNKNPPQPLSLTQGFPCGLCFPPSVLVCSRAQHMCVSLCVRAGMCVPECVA